MNSKLLNSFANVLDNKEDIIKRSEYAKKINQELEDAMNNCQNRFGGKSELATEDDVRIVKLCECWEKALSHGIKTNLSNTTLQGLVAAGLNLTFNIVNIGNSLWSYTCLHLTKHEKERFKILSNINTPLGYFRAFLRASLNERSLERYLLGWTSHGLLQEYYEEGSLLRDEELSRQLPTLASGLSTVLFALSIDRAELNETQQNNATKPEPVILLPMPVKTNSNMKRKPVRQVISFDKIDNENVNKPVTASCKKAVFSAPTSYLNSPDPQTASQPQGPSSLSEPTSSEHKSGIRHFFPDSVRAIDTPSQFITKLSERAKEMFTSSHSIDSSAAVKDDVSGVSVNNLKISESDSEEVAGSINGSTSCIELCFTEDEGGTDEAELQALLESKEREILCLQFKYNQSESANKERIQKYQKIVLDLSKENERLKEQLKQYMSAVEMSKALKSGNANQEDINEYEKKLVQVAEMHAELMEFNQHLQRRIQELEGLCSLELVESPESNVKVYIPTAFLVGKRTSSYHVYQIFLKVGAEEWNVYHRYAKFHELHSQLKKCHSDIATYKFPPKKTIGKLSKQFVEQRRVALQAYLRHVLFVIPELRACTNRPQLVAALPFFGISSASPDNGFSAPTSLTSSVRQQSIDNVSSYGVL